MCAKNVSHYPPGPKRLLIVGNLFSMPSSGSPTGTGPPSSVWLVVLSSNVPTKPPSGSDVIHADVLVIIINSL